MQDADASPPAPPADSSGPSPTRVVSRPGIALGWLLLVLLASLVPLVRMTIARLFR
jgi:hypothetical protein